MPTRLFTIHAQLNVPIGEQMELLRITMVCWLKMATSLGTGSLIAKILG